MLSLNPAGAMMLSVPSGPAGPLHYLAALFAALMAGVVDHSTGADVHVLSLYFVAVVFAGWRFQRAGAVFVALLTTAIWLGVRYSTGWAYPDPWHWVVNYVLQALGYVFLAMLVGMFSEALRREQLLRRQDPLTGLKTRLALQEQGAAALSICQRHGRPVALAFIDLDNFKNVNDSMGHARGDELLRRCGAVINAALRRGDIAARLGGDEFAVLLPETNVRNAATLMERLRCTLESCGHLSEVGVTASIGVVVDEQADCLIDELLRHADAQMYAVKKDGKNRVGIRRLDRP